MLDVAAHSNLPTRLPLYPDARKRILPTHPTGRAQLRHLPGVRKNFHPGSCSSDRTRFQTLPAKVSGSNIKPTNRSTTSSPFMMTCISGLSPWSLKAVRLSDKDRQWSLPCPWDTGHCYAEGLTYVWNVTEPEYCPVAVVKKFLGHRLQANVSHSGDSLDSHQAESHRQC